MTPLQDSFGRKFPYLRLSVTDACNFRCQYCLPDGYQKQDNMKFLSVEEITRLVKAFAGIGMWKIRLTGGEPTIRKDFLEIATNIAKIPGIREIAVTTNGYHLAKQAQDYYDAGITALNVSIDSLNHIRFKNITGHDRLELIIDGLDKAKQAGFKRIKINAVLLKGINDDELDSFLTWIKNEPISVRFIELMQTGQNLEYFHAHHLSGEVILQSLRDRGWTEAPRKEGAGPAIEMKHDQYQGSVGVISPYSKDFCKSCNRLRVTARGELMLCLFGSKAYNLRQYLRSDDQMLELQDKIQELLHFKTASHYLQQGNTGITPHLASIGG